MVIVEKITKEEFDLWRSHTITLQMFEALEELKADVEENMKDDSLIMSADAQVRLARLSGVREGINTVLNLDVEEFVEDDE